MGCGNARLCVLTVPAARSIQSAERFSKWVARLLGLRLLRDNHEHLFLRRKLLGLGLPAVRTTRHATGTRVAKIILTDIPSVISHVTILARIVAKARNISPPPGPPKPPGPPRPANPPFRAGPPGFMTTGVGVVMGAALTRGISSTTP